MTTTYNRRLPVLLTGLVLTGTALVTAAPPASAAVVSGHATATSAVETGGLCDVDGDGDSQTQPFSNRTGSQTAEATGTYRGAADGAVGVSGRSTLETTASATARNRAFREVELESTQAVTLKNDSAVDCGLEIVAHSQGDATLRVRERGRIKFEYLSSVGDLEQISLTGPAGTVISRDPSRASGAFSVRVRPGTYQLLATFTTSIRESEVAATQSLTRIGFFWLSATYQG